MGLISWFTGDETIVEKPIEDYVKWGGSAQNDKLDYVYKMVTEYLERTNEKGGIDVFWHWKCQNDFGNKVPECDWDTKVRRCINEEEYNYALKQNEFIEKNYEECSLKDFWFRYKSAIIRDNLTWGLKKTYTVPDDHLIIEADKELNEQGFDANIKATYLPDGTLSYEIAQKEISW